MAYAMQACGVNHKEFIVLDRPNPINGVAVEGPMLDEEPDNVFRVSSRINSTWGGNLAGLNFDDIYYYVRPSEASGRTWDEVPDTIKKTFDRLGIPEAEKKYLAGVKAQYESEVVYGSSPVVCGLSSVVRRPLSVVRRPSSYPNVAP